MVTFLKRMSYDIDFIMKENFSQSPKQVLNMK